jgi:hypothetical protein
VSCFWVAVGHFAHAAPWLQSLLQSEGFSDDAALDQAIKKLEADLRKTRKKAANDGDDAMVRPLLQFWKPYSFTFCRKNPPSRSSTPQTTRYALTSLIEQLREQLGPLAR